MNKTLKIVLSVVFVLAVSFLAARFFVVQWKKAPAGPVHVIKKAAKPLKVPVHATEARMAIILDDWGLNAPLVDTAIAIGRPLTLSVLPHLRHSRDIAEKARAHGLGVMLHMPMQPKGLRQPKEPHTILTTSSEAEITGALDEALRSVPEAEGVNNHQGSAATSDPRVMRTVLSYLKGKGLFFVDSKVISSSVGARTAAEVGVRFSQRDVFIDNQPDVAAVVAQLKKAESIALSHGKAVVIGHDKKVTLEAIRQMVPEFDKNGVKLVLVKELVE